MRANCKNITFSSDGFRLKGVLHLPARNAPPVVIGSHGLLSSSSSPKQIALAQKCSQLGIAFFRFDHRGCGSSQGTSRDVPSFHGRCSDLISAIQAVKNRSDTGNRIGLFGSSMGGAVCLSAASTIEVDALVTFAALIRSAPIIEALKKSKNSDVLKSGLFENEYEFDISDKLSEIHNILIFHGESDHVVPVSHALEIYEKASGSKKLILQEKGDHRMSNKAHQRQFILEAASWFNSCFIDTAG